jgi:DNA-binding transcriptional LysR family regulator
VIKYREKLWIEINWDIINTDNWVIKIFMERSDFKSIRYVATIAESGTISGAARALGISQPSLTKYIQRLQGELGVELFYREGGKLIPTYAGNRYLSNVRSIIPLLDDLCNFEQPAAKFLRVAYLPFEGVYIHPFTIQKFHEAHPDYQLIIRETRDLVSEVASGYSDLAIINFPLSETEAKGYALELLVHDELLLVTSENHPVGKTATWNAKCRNPWVDINLLRNDMFVQLYPEQTTRKLSDELLAREHIKPRILMQTRSVLSAIRVVSTRAAVCFAPGITMRNYALPEPLSFFSVGDPVTMKIYCIYRNGNTEIIEEFINLMRTFL